MFARLTSFQMNLDKLDEAMKIYQEVDMPETRAEKGYRGVCLLINRKTEKGVSIVLWDSEEDAIANEQSGVYQKQIDMYKDFLVGSTVREGYEVIFQE